MSAPPSPSPAGNQDEAPQQSEHLNIKVTDNNNEVFFKIKRTTQLKKLMDAFCERQGKSFTSVRFLFDGTRVNPTDNPEMVSYAQSRSKDSRDHRQSQNANTGTARNAGRRYSRGPPGADRWRLLICAQASSLLDTSALHDRDEDYYTRTKTSSKRLGRKETPGENTWLGIVSGSVVGLEHARSGDSNDYR
jgi:hypothetical protein